MTPGRIPVGFGLQPAPDTPNGSMRIFLLQLVLEYSFTVKSAVLTSL